MKHLLQRTDTIKSLVLSPRKVRWFSEHCYTSWILLQTRLVICQYFPLPLVCIIKYSNTRLLYAYHIIGVACNSSSTSFTCDFVQHTQYRSALWIQCVLVTQVYLCRVRTHPSGVHWLHAGYVKLCKSCDVSDLLLESFTRIPSCASVSLSLTSRVALSEPEACRVILPTLTRVLHAHAHNQPHAQNAWQTHII